MTISKSTPENRSLSALVNCSQLVTLAGPDRPRVGAEMRELAIIRDGAMLFRDGKIEAVGSRGEIEALLTSDVQIIDAEGRVVTPGFVDAHTHLVFAGNRADEFEMRCSGITYQEIARQGGGIRSTVRRTRTARKTSFWPSRKPCVLVPARRHNYDRSKIRLWAQRRSRDEDPARRATNKETTLLRCVAYVSGRARSAGGVRWPHRAYVELVIERCFPLLHGKAGKLL